MGHCGDVEECWRDSFLFCRFHASAIASTSNNVVVVFSFISSVGKRRHQQKGSCKQIFLSPVRSQRWSTHKKIQENVVGLLFVSSLIRSKRKRQKDARTDYIHLPTRSKRCNRFTIQMGGGNSTHSRSIGKKKTQNGSRNVASIFKQRAREISKNPKFENNNPQNNNFFEFLALKMIIVFCQSTLGT